MAGIATQSTSDVPDPLIDDFLKGHSNSDTDLTYDAIHHTLGPSQTQAAPGNHTHNNTQIFTATGSTGSGSLIPGLDTMEVDVPKSTTSNGRYIITASIPATISATPMDIDLRVHDGGTSNPTTSSTIIGRAPYASPADTSVDTKFFQFSVLLSSGKHILGVSPAILGGAGTVSAGQKTAFSLTFQATVSIQLVGIV